MCPDLSENRQVTNIVKSGKKSKVYRVSRADCVLL